MTKNPFPEKWLRRIMPPKILLPIAIAGIILIIISAFFEYRSRHQDYLDMLENRATIFIRTILTTAHNTFSAAAELENEINNNLYSNLKLIEFIDRNTQVTEQELKEIPGISVFNEIQIYNDNYRLTHKFYSSVEVPVVISRDALGNIVRGEISQSLYVFPDTVTYEEDYYAALVRREKGGVIAGLISSDKITRFRRIFGFGKIFRSFIKGESVEYVVLENELTIIAGFFQGYSLTPLPDDRFLREAFLQEGIKTRIIGYERGDVFEAAVTYKYDGEPVGLLRMGLSMDELEEISARAKRRLFIVSGLIVVIGIIFINFILSYRHRQLLRKELSDLHVYTNTILDNLESGVITINSDGTVKVVNRQASKYLGLDYADAFNKPYTIFPRIFTDAVEECRNRSEAVHKTCNFSMPESHEPKCLSLRTTLLREDNEKDTCIMLVDDVTYQLQLEEQQRRTEKVEAMGRLASGVAHEIRNPLNSIKLVVDLLKEAYVPERKREKYEKYIIAVREEISRISSIVEEFLRFARPPDLHPESVDFRIFFDEIKTLYGPGLKSSRISLITEIEEHPPYTGDAQQLKQVFINLIENASHACGEEGTIEIKAKIDGNAYVITVRDDGKGIPSGDIDRIFDIYYTTKKDGTGIGLAIVHQIITRHGGTITVESEEGTGTVFTIRLPLSSELEKVT